LDNFLQGIDLNLNRILFILNRVMPVTLIRKGNTVFSKNEKIPSSLDSMGVDRIVYEPELPI